MVEIDKGCQHFVDTCSEIFTKVSAECLHKKKNFTQIEYKMLTTSVSARVRIVDPTLSVAGKMYFQSRVGAICELQFTIQIDLQIRFIFPEL